MRAHLRYHFACCLAGPDRMPRIFRGIERLLVRLYDVFQLVRIDLLHSPLTLVCGESEFAKP